MSDIIDAAKRRAEAAEQRRDNLIEALQDERRGYVMRGNDARVKQVDEQIALAKKAAPAEPAAPSPDAAATEAKLAAAPENATAKPPAKPAAKAPAKATARKPATPKK